jgi:hypothetical protein
VVDAEVVDGAAAEAGVGELVRGDRAQVALPLDGGPAVDVAALERAVRRREVDAAAGREEALHQVEGRVDVGDVLEHLEQRHRVVLRRVGS